MKSRALLLTLAVSANLASLAFAEEVLHEVTASAPKATVGTKGTATVTLAAKNGWHMNDQAPVVLKLTPAPGLTVEKTKLGRPDLAETTREKARFDVPFTATEPGQKSLEGEALYVICQESACKQVKEKITLAIDVSAAKKK